jgi:serine/threonine-protein kinase
MWGENPDPAALGADRHVPRLDDVAGDALLGREMGRYRIESIIGSGGFATVYRAIDLALERPIALKVVDPTAHRNPTIGRRFVLEGRAVASLDHPAVVPVYDAGENDGVLWMAMRLIPGGSLDDALVTGRRFTFDQVAAVIARIGDALDHAHGHGIVHRDVKPSNILLEQNDPGRAWLADFGIAATTRTAGRYTTGALGTAAYMAPEQARPSSVGPPADLYSLGCVAYELLTRRRPFPGDDYVELLLAHATHPVPPTPWPRVDGFMQRALAKDPATRPSSGAAFANELRRALHEADEARRPPAPSAPAPTGALAAAAAPLPPPPAGASPPAQPSVAAAPAAPAAAHRPPPPPPPHRPGDPVASRASAAAAAPSAPPPPSPAGGGKAEPAVAHRPASPSPAAAADETSTTSPAPADRNGDGTPERRDEAPTVVERVDKTLEHPGLRPLPPPPTSPPPDRGAGHRPPPPGGGSSGLRPPPPTPPRDPTVVRTGRRRGRNRLVVGGVLLAVGIVAGVVAWLDQRDQGGQRVTDDAGIAYDLPEDWSPHAAPPKVTLQRDGVTAATTVHGESDGRSASQQLDAASPSVCDAAVAPRDDTGGVDQIEGADEVAQCVNTSATLPVLAVGAVVDDQFWVITVQQSAPLDERDQFLQSIEFTPPDAAL